MRTHCVKSAINTNAAGPSTPSTVPCGGHAVQLGPAAPNPSAQAPHRAPWRVTLPVVESTAQRVRTVNAFTSTVVLQAPRTRHGRKSAALNDASSVPATRASRHLAQYTFESASRGSSPGAHLNKRPPASGQRSQRLRFRCAKYPSSQLTHLPVPFVLMVPEGHNSIVVEVHCMPSGHLRACTGPLPALSGGGAHTKPSEQDFGKLKPGSSQW